MFDNTRLFDLDDLTQEYCEMFEKYPGESDLGILRAHLFKFLHQGLTEHTQLRQELGSAKGLDNILAVVRKMKELRKDTEPKQKLGWYYRHWAGMKLDKNVDPTYKDVAWDEQCQSDWRVNGEL